MTVGIIGNRNKNKNGKSYYDRLTPLHREFFMKYLADTEVPPPVALAGQVMTVGGQWVNQKQEVDQTMFDECTPCSAPRTKVRGAVANAQIIGNVPMEATQRDYAIELIKSLGEKHAQALRKQFHVDGNRPQTAQELISMIENKQYTLDTVALAKNAEEIKRGYYNNEFGITWGTPPDNVGYEAAREALKSAAQKVLTAVTLRPIDVLEGVIDDFEAWVYTPAA